MAFARFAAQARTRLDDSDEDRRRFREALDRLEARFARELLLLCPTSEDACSRADVSVALRSAEIDLVSASSPLRAIRTSYEDVFEPGDNLIEGDINPLLQRNQGRILADGGEAEACGNGTRCVAAMIMAETGARETAIETKAGLLAASAAGDGRIAVDLGPVGLDWRSIPLAREADTLHLGIQAGPLSDPVAVGIGNPHMVFFVDDAEAVPLEDLGPGLEADPLYPERANVGVAEILDGGSIRLRVWERGAGLTPACGSGACAALVAANRRGLTGRKAAVVVDGGTLHIEWREDNHVVMTGPVATSFSGTLDPELLA
ncbi:MAG: diaminopimelate epimerase [Proteobacteria bacterium]|nr:diaminopimelate epimerase [Pseudomonadota bacterium]